VRGEEWQQEAMIQHLSVHVALGTPELNRARAVVASALARLRRILLASVLDVVGDAAHGAVAFYWGWWTRSWAWLSERGAAIPSH